MRQDIISNSGEGMPERTAGESRRPSKNANKSMTASVTKGPSKKKRGGKGVIAIILVILAVLAGMCYYFNILGMKTKVIAFFINQDEQYEQAMASQQAAEDLLNQQQAEIEDQQAEIERRNVELNEREAAVSHQEGEAADEQAEAEEKQAGLEKMAKIYEGMDSAAAAGILGDFTDMQWIADLLSQMSEKKAAAILTAMDTKLAAEITLKMTPQ